MEKNIYETVVIFNTTEKDKEKAVKKEVDKMTKQLQTYSDTKKVQADYMGEKNLAYEIKEFSTGYYAVFKWQGTSDNMKELERLLRANDTVIKFITLKHDDDSEPELEDLDTSEQIDQDTQEPLLDIYQLLFS